MNSVDQWHFSRCLSQIMKGSAMVLWWLGAVPPRFACHGNPFLSFGIGLEPSYGTRFQYQVWMYSMGFEG
jgi:hypothetical protein